MSPQDKPLVWMHGEISTPPFSENARIEAGYLLRQLQKGKSLSLPQSRPMPSIGTRCHELRINMDKRKKKVLERTSNISMIFLAKNLSYIIIL